MHLRWSTTYGRFSKAFFDELYSGENVLLSKPQLLRIEDDLIFTSALWHYMTPLYPMPSAHQIMNGDFFPNNMDQVHGSENDFGTTIAVMAQDDPQSVFTSECF